MDFFDDQYAGGRAFEEADFGLPDQDMGQEMGAHDTDSAPGALAAQLNIDGAVSQTIARAIRDATQSADPARQHEAASWLLICCPDIAEQVELPDLHVDAMATLAAAYVMAAHDGATAHTRVIFS